MKLSLSAVIALAVLGLAPLTRAQDSSASQNSAAAIIAAQLAQAASQTAAQGTAQGATQTATTTVQGASQTVAVRASIAAWIILGGLPPLGVTNVTATPATLPGARTYLSDGAYVNFSVRGTVAGSGQPIIAGFAISGGRKVTLIRAVGPTLASFGVSGVLAAPRLDLFDSTGQRIATAVSWVANSADIRDQIKAVTATTGAFPLPDNTTDAVLLAVLDAGTYTCVVTAPDGTSGQVLLEGYDVRSLVVNP